MLSNLNQLYRLCESYFKYSVATEVRIASHDNITLANVAICFDFLEVLNWTAVSIHERHKFLYIARKLGLQIDENKLISTGLTDEQIRFITSATRKAITQKKIGLGYLLMDGIQVSDLFSYTLPRNKIIEGMLFPHDPSKLAVFLSLSQLSELVKIRRYMLAYQMCYILTLDALDISSILQARDLVSPGLVYQLSFTPDLPSRTESMNLLYMSEDRPRHGFTKTIRLTFGNGAFSTTHLQITRKLLEPPFETNCRNYTRIENGKQVASLRAECHETCAFQWSLKMFGLVYPAVAFSRRDGTTRIIAPVIENPLAGTHPPFNISMVETRCSRLCFQQDCQSNTYIPIFNAYFTQESGLINFLPSNPPIHIKTKPVTSWSVFILNVFSSFSFWFGFSLLNLEEIFAFILCKRTCSDLMEIRDENLNRLSQVDRVRHVRETKRHYQWKWYITPTDHLSRDFSIFNGRSSVKDKIR